MLGKAADANNATRAAAVGIDPKSPEYILNVAGTSPNTATAFGVAAAASGTASDVDADTAESGNETNAGTAITGTASQRTVIQTPERTAPSNPAAPALLQPCAPQCGGLSAAPTMNSSVSGGIGGGGLCLQNPMACAGKSRSIEEEIQYSDLAFGLHRQYF